MVFGKVMDGFDVLDEIEKADDRGHFKEDVRIGKCGELAIAKAEL